MGRENNGFEGELAHGIAVVAQCPLQKWAGLPCHRLVREKISAAPKKRAGSTGQVLPELFFWHGMM